MTAIPLMVMKLLTKADRVNLMKLNKPLFSLTDDICTVAFWGEVRATEKGRLSLTMLSNCDAEIVNTLIITAVKNNILHLVIGIQTTVKPHF